MKDNFLMIKLMVKESYSFRMEISITEILLIISWKGLGYLLIKMVIGMKDLGLTIRGVDKGNIFM